MTLADFSMQTKKVTLDDAQYDVAALCARLVKESQWFSVMPLPFGRYEIAVRTDYVIHFRALVKSYERDSYAAVSKRELAQIEASLRHCQDAGVDFADEGLAPLSDDEVVELCERLRNELVVRDSEERIDVADQSPSP